MKLVCVCDVQYCTSDVQGVCDRDGRATAFVWSDESLIPAGGALEVWPCDFGPKQFGK